METIEYKKLSMNIWDVGGHEKIRVLWSHYIANTQAIIWGLDSTDSDRFEESKDELDRLLAENDLS